jgi:hypothetical protein
VRWWRSKASISPVVNGGVGVIGANVGSAVVAVGEGEAAWVVDLVLERIEGAPLRRRES